jgi:hypothetical protein
MSSTDFAKLLDKLNKSLPLLESFSDKDTCKCITSLIEKINSLRFTEITPSTLKSFTDDFNDCICVFTKKIVETNPEQVIDKYIKRINEYGFQGGFGHYVSSNIHFPCHWVIYPAFYEICKPVPIEQLCFLVDNREIKVSGGPSTQRWGN